MRGVYKPGLSVNLQLIYKSSQMMDSCVAYNPSPVYKRVGDRRRIEAARVHEWPLVEISAVYLQYVKYPYLSL